MNIENDDRLRRDVEVAIGTRDIGTGRVYATAVSSFGAWLIGQGEISAEPTRAARILAVARYFVAAGEAAATDAVRRYLADVLYESRSIRYATARVHLAAVRWLARSLLSFHHIDWRLQLASVPVAPDGFVDGAQIKLPDDLLQRLMHFAKNDSDPRMYPIAALVFHERRPVGPLHLMDVRDVDPGEFSRLTLIAIETWLRVRPGPRRGALFTGGPSGSRSCRIASRTAHRILQRCIAGVGLHFPASKAHLPALISAANGAPT